MRSELYKKSFSGTAIPVQQMVCRFIRHAMLENNPCPDQKSDAKMGQGPKPSHRERKPEIPKIHSYTCRRNRAYPGKPNPSRQKATRRKKEKICAASGGRSRSISEMLETGPVHDRCLPWNLGAKEGTFRSYLGLGVFQRKVSDSFNPEIQRRQPEAVALPYDDGSLQRFKMGQKEQAVFSMGVPLPSYRGTLLRPQQMVFKTMRRRRCKTFLSSFFTSLFFKFGGNQGSDDQGSPAILPARQYDHDKHLPEGNCPSELGFNKTPGRSFGDKIKGPREKSVCRSSANRVVTSHKKNRQLKKLPVFNGLPGGAKEDRTPDLMTARVSAGKTSHNYTTLNPTKINTYIDRLVSTFVYFCRFLAISTEKCLQSVCKT